MKLPQEQHRMKLPQEEQPVVRLPQEDQLEPKLPQEEQPVVKLPQGEQHRVELPQEEQPVMELPQEEQPMMVLPQEEQPEEETMAAPAATQEVAREPHAQDGEMGYKVVAPLDALQKRGRADDGRGDEKKLRADSPAIIDYVCMYSKEL
jgi:hypothetical protein